MENYIKEFIKKLNFTNGKYDIRQVFSDVIALAVCVIQFGMLFNDEYKQKYDTILEKYDEKERTELQVIVLELAELYNKQTEPKDIMTAIFAELGLGNKHTGQFFTPTHISDLMVKTVSIDDKEIKEKGYISLHEPTCGAGGMILSFARELKSKGFNPSKNLVVVAWDIDVLCTNMTYLQLSMYDIPAAVTNGDTLSLKENFTLYTPQYYIFNKMLQEGKLNIPICYYCGAEITAKKYMSKLGLNAELCERCYKSENTLMLMKDIIASHKN